MPSPFPNRVLNAGGLVLMLPGNAEAKAGSKGRANTA
jgi:hypothetical protein